jgi:hypothetical protein
MKSGQLPPELSGRLVHLLSVLAGLTTQERPLTAVERQKAKRNAEIDAALDPSSERMISQMVGVPVAPRGASRRRQ